MSPIGRCTVAIALGADSHTVTVLVVAPLRVNLRLGNDALGKFGSTIDVTKHKLRTNHSVLPIALGYSSWATTIFR